MCAQCIPTAQRDLIATATDRKKVYSRSQRVRWSVRRLEDSIGCEVAGTFLSPVPKDQSYTQHRVELSGGQQLEHVFRLDGPTWWCIWQLIYVGQAK